MKVSPYSRFVAYKVLPYTVPGVLTTDEHLAAQAALRLAQLDVDAARLRLEQARDLLTWHSRRDAKFTAVTNLLSLGQVVDARLVTAQLRAMDVVEGGAADRAPFSNTGLLPTEPLLLNPWPEAQRKGKRGLVDWCAFTLGDSFTGSESDVIRDFLGHDPSSFHQQKGGMLGYARRVVCGGISVYWAGLTPGMGIHVELSGQGCRELEVLRDVGCWGRFLLQVLGAGAKFTRLDIALDDFDGALQLSVIRACLEKAEGFEVRRRVKGEVIRDTPNCVRTPFRFFDKFDRHDAWSGASLAQTLYFGSTKGNAMIRIYDKAAKEKYDGHWVRCETQLRDRHAQDAAELLAAGIQVGKLGADLLRKYLAFVDPCTDKNYSRWPLASWWATWLGDVDKLCWSVVEVVKTLDKTREWFLHAVATSFASFALSVESHAPAQFAEFVAAAVLTGKGKMKAHHLARIPLLYDLMPPPSPLHRCPVNSIPLRRRAS